MISTKSGSFRLFQLFGIDVFLHWSWLVVALFEINNRRERYDHLAWNVAEYLALFGIVLMHEFGHALACRQVGGTADRIILWPLGGVAFVSPPPRPGANLWAIAAGPLVNLILLPLAVGAALFFQRAGWDGRWPDVQNFLWAMAWINGGLLVFNLLPIYPLDGGQILRSLLWFFLGRARSLLVATLIGLVGAVGLILLALFKGSIWIAIMGGFILLTCWRAWSQARILSRLESGPTHQEASCPNCRNSPPAGPFWVCADCRTAFDTFATGATCPKCQKRFELTGCPHCGHSRPMSEWVNQPRRPTPPPILS